MAHTVHYHTHEAQKQEWLKKLGFSVVMLVLSTAMTWYVSKGLNLDQLLGEDESIPVEDHVQELLQKHSIDPTPAERRMAATIITPDRIASGLESLGGVDTQIDLLWRAVAIPFQFADVFAKSQGLPKAPPGILFVGPPGTGKTLMAKALAKECQATFFNVSLSNLENKYFGETSRNIKALYSLATRMAPSIVWIDEVDGLIRTRSSDDQSFVHSMKTELMASMDGLLGCKKPVVTIAATNTSISLDSAFKRRLPLVIKFELPELEARKSVLAITSKQQGLEISQELHELICEQTEGASCSDLTEIVRLVLDERSADMLNSEEFKAKLLQAQDHGSKLELPVVTEEIVNKAIDRWAASKDAANIDNKVSQIAKMLRSRK